MRRRAVVMCLINNKGIIENATISKTLGIPIRTIQDSRKELERSGDLEMVVKRKVKPQEASRAVRDADFVARIQTIIDDDLSKSVRAIARNFIYLEVIKDKVLLWIMEVAGNRPWVWLRDSASCQTSRKSMLWLENNCFLTW